jgi:hypothetical protein
MAIVLDQRGVALRKGPFWRKEANRHRKLQQRNGQSREQRLKQPRRAGHYIIIAARGQFVRESLPVGRTRPVASFCSRERATGGKRHGDGEHGETARACGIFDRSNLGSHRFQSGYGDLSSRGLTASASRLFARATLPLCSLPRLATVATLFHSGQRNHYGAEITSTISPFGERAS